MFGTCRCLEILKPNAKRQLYPTFAANFSALFHLFLRVPYVSLFFGSELRRVVPPFIPKLVDELVAKGSQQGREELTAKAEAKWEEIQVDFKSMSEELAASASVDRCFSLVSHLIHYSLCPPPLIGAHPHPLAHEGWSLRFSGVVETTARRGGCCEVPCAVAIPALRVSE